MNQDPSTVELAYVRSASRLSIILAYSLPPALASSIVLLRAFEWNIVHIVSPFLMFPLFLLAYMFVGISILLSLFIWFASGWRIRGSIPLIISLLCVVLAWTVPFHDIWLEANFRLHRQDRERIVRAVIEGTLRPDSGETIRLPDSMPRVSMYRNEVIVEFRDGKAYVFFYTFHGILHNYAGFLYVADGGDPKRLTEGRAVRSEITPYRENWYFVTYY